jgi:small subunit ribosomal protein S4e
MRTSKIPCDKNKVLLTRVSLHSIRYPDPAIKVNDTVKVETATGKILDYVRFDTGAVIMATGGRNMGRVGVVTHRERHDGGFNIVHVKDAIDNTFATRESNVFVIGQDKPWVSLPKGKGVKVCYLHKSMLI